MFDGAGEVNEEEVNVVKTPEGELVLCGLEKLIVCASITCATAGKRMIGTYVLTLVERVPYLDNTRLSAYMRRNELLPRLNVPS